LLAEARERASQRHAEPILIGSPDWAFAARRPTARMRRRRQRQEISNLVAESMDVLPVNFCGILAVFRSPR